MVEYTSSSGPVTTSEFTVLIDPQVAIGSYLANLAFNWTATFGLMRLYGTIWGSDGIQAPSTSAVDVSVQAGGAIATSGNAVAGGVRYVENQGTIAGRIQPNGATFRLYNYNTISTLDSNNTILSSATQSTDILNYGTITGNHRTITALTGVLTISNHGSISAGNDNGVVIGVPPIVGGSVIQVNNAATLTLTNSGTISGDPGSDLVAITASTQNDTVTNYGVIVGDALLGGGSDRFDTTSGTLAGVLFLGDGADTGIGGAALDRMDGGAGNDILSGNAGDDQLDGGTDDDIIDGGTGNDRMTGGAGNDLFYVDTARDLVLEAANGGSDTVYAAVSYTLRAGQEVEFLLADPASDVLGITLAGNAFAQAITGDAGDNRIVGGGGADTLTGLAGNDTYIVSDTGVVIVEAANGGYDAVVTSVSLTLADNVEAGYAANPYGTDAIDLTGNALDNQLRGNAGANTLDGGAGADRMVGGAGNDTYVVDDAHDVIADYSGTDTVRAGISYVAPGTIENIELTGTAAIDATGNIYANTITGNDGDNTLSGGRGGQDTLTGGDGADIFLMSAAFLATNLSTITDIATGTDRIGLAVTAFRNVGAAGTLGDAFFTEGAATTRDQHILYDADTGVISYDRDGSGIAFAAIAFASVTPQTTLTAADFLVI